MSVFNFALYIVCNVLRHCDVRSELRLCLFRIMGEIYLQPSAKKAWGDIFEFQGCHAGSSCSWRRHAPARDGVVRRQDLPAATAHRAGGVD